MKSIKQKVKSILCVLLTFTMVTGISSTVKAVSISETEPNNTKDSAASISCHRQTAQEFLKGNTTNTFIVKGDTGPTEEDWFKVYLDTSKDTYFSMAADSLRYRIYDYNGNPITELIRQTDGPNAWHVYDYNDLASGYYYIQLIGDARYSNYMFMIGNPNLKMGQVHRVGENITLSSSQKTVSRLVDFSSGQYPKDSQIYTIMVGGALSTVVSKVDVSFSNSDKKFSEMYSAGWSNISVPLNYNYSLIGRYTFTYTYKSARTFIPEYDFYYIYPVLP